MKGPPEIAMMSSTMNLFMRWISSTKPASRLARIAIECLR